MCVDVCGESNVPIPTLSYLQDFGFCVAKVLLAIFLKHLCNRLVGCLLNQPIRVKIAIL